MRKLARTEFRGRVRGLVLAALLLFPAMVSGCRFGGGFVPPAIVVYPDAPYLVQEVRGTYARIFVYEKKGNKLIDAGWVDLSTMVGRTVSKYDWERFMDKKEKERSSQHQGGRPGDPETVVAHKRLKIVGADDKKYEFWCTSTQPVWYVARLFMNETGQVTTKGKDYTLCTIKGVMLRGSKSLQGAGVQFSNTYRVVEASQGYGRRM